ncbi:MAG TPA: ATP phosphoribosyltransferase regulatory subunit [Chromatiales bacterium]|nr:ATP phosphoribosyltransferase regulatory subunit [Thiotrichales bacterium]HIP69371.1 ATP phosphoribosyltransferase regulatory subunit [Chromatiales bacterium]
MSVKDYWLLPEGIDESLPAEAARLEDARRQLIDLYRSWGYELVMPPLIEYLESLLVGSPDLDLQTFKLTDQLTGRMMGVRADMTPQVARIDAHRLKSEVPTRLCYLGTVLKTRPDNFAGSRSPLQVGVELYGHSGIDSDLEVLSMMLETLNLCGIKPPIHVDIGHVGIFRELARQAELDESQEAVLFDMLQRKARTEISDWLDKRELRADVKKSLESLAMLNGSREVLEEARALPGFAAKQLQGYLDELGVLSDHIAATYPEVEINFDLSELRGYHYETGIVFAAYLPGEGRELARGGRYDGIGKRFGRARAATGFSADLKTLMRLGRFQSTQINEKIFAPVQNDPELMQQIKQLRAQGSIVVQSLSGQLETAADMGCSAELVKQNDQWVVQKIMG